MPGGGVGVKADRAAENIARGQTEGETHRRASRNGKPHAPEPRGMMLPRAPCLHSARQRLRFRLWSCPINAGVDPGLHARLGTLLQGLPTLRDELNAVRTFREYDAAANLVCAHVWHCLDACAASAAIPNRLNLLNLAADHFPEVALAPPPAFTIPKRDGSDRAIRAPKQQRLWTQRHIPEHVLSKVSAHNAAHGFVPVRSTVTNVRSPGCRSSMRSFTGAGPA